MKGYPRIEDESGSTKEDLLEQKNNYKKSKGVKVANQIV